MGTPAVSAWTIGEPSGGDGVGRLVAAEGGPGEGPGPGHDLVDGVAPPPVATIRPWQWRSAISTTSLNQLLEQASGAAQVGQGIEGVGVAPRLDHDDVRSERLGELGDHRIERRQEGGVLRLGLQRDVGGEPVPVAIADLVDEPGGREEVEAALVDGDRQDLGVAVEDGLDAIAMVAS
jgi:hypothetical protein